MDWIGWNVWNAIANNLQVNLMSTKYLIRNGFSKVDSEPIVANGMKGPLQMAENNLVN